MANLKDLEKYLKYTFSSGCETGEDYKTFEKKYINYLKSMAQENGWELVKANKNHYEFSAFLKCEDKYVYISISDVRFFTNDWYNHVLFRTAKNDMDYTGGTNHYTTLPILYIAIQNLLNGGYDNENR